MIENLEHLKHLPFYNRLLKNPDYYQDALSVYNSKSEEDREKLVIEDIETGLRYFVKTGIQIKIDETI
jgi:hypothetical protein